MLVCFLVTQSLGQRTGSSLATGAGKRKHTSARRETKAGDWEVERSYFSIDVYSTGLILTNRVCDSC